MEEIEDSSDKAEKNHQWKKNEYLRKKQVISKTNSILHTPLNHVSPWYVQIDVILYLSIFGMFYANYLFFARS